MLNELKEKQRKGKQNTQVEKESQQQLHEVLKQVADSVSRYIAPSSLFIYIYIKKLRLLTSLRLRLFMAVRHI